MLKVLYHKNRFTCVCVVVCLFFACFFVLFCLFVCLFVVLGGVGVSFSK